VGLWITLAIDKVLLKNIVMKRSKINKNDNFMEMTILSGEKFWEELAKLRRQQKEEERKKVEAVASYMAAEIKRIEK
jgi:hypothetical protein